MKFKKLTVAALIALGIGATSVGNTAMAACPCNSQSQTMSAPCEKVSKNVINATK